MTAQSHRSSWACRFACLLMCTSCDRCPANVRRTARVPRGTRGHVRRYRCGVIGCAGAVNDCSRKAGQGPTACTRGLVADLVTALEREHLARLATARDLQPQALDDLARPADLLGVAPG